MKTKKKLTKAGRILLAVLIAAVLLIVTLITKPWNLMQKEEASPSAAPSASAIASAAPSASADATYAENKAVNADYVGALKFDSGLVEQNVVQADDNEKYLSLA